MQVTRKEIQINRSTRAEEGDPMASPCRAGARVIQRVQGIPFRHGCGRSGGGGDPARPGRPLPPWLAALVVGGDRWGVPAYGGIVYCKRSILELSFIDQ